MAFKGMYFDKQIADSISWRLATRRFFGNQDGRLQGCNVTRSGNSVSISTGYFIICGGTIQITATETLSAGTSGTKKLCYQIDLTQSNTDNEFNQGSFVWVTGTPTQQDLFNGGTLYQLPIATVITNGTSITSMTVDLKDITGDVMSYIDLINLKLSGYDSAFNVSGANVNFLGLVKQNGVSIVESYYSIDGSYTKFSNGLMVQTKTVSSQNFNINCVWFVPFVGKYNAVATNIYSQTNVAIWNVVSLNSSSADFSVGNWGGSSVGEIIAIGRWR